MRSRTEAFSISFHFHKIVHENTFALTPSCFRWVRLIEGYCKTRPHRSYCFLSIFKLRCKRHYGVSKMSAAAAAAAHSFIRNKCGWMTNCSRDWTTYSSPIWPSMMFLMTVVIVRFVCSLHELALVRFVARSRLTPTAILFRDGMRYSAIYRVAQKVSPLPNYQKIVLNRIEACQWD